MKAGLLVRVMGFLSGGLMVAAASGERPNFVFFLVDDLGWADIGVNGSRFYETPNIDALAAGGVRFTQAYAAGSVCSPTRASIMTGRHPVRVNITDWLPGNDVARRQVRKYLHVEDAEELALSEVTLAEVLREAGYETFFAGKWHLGGEGHLPTDQGFDFNVGGFHVGSPPGGYYAPWKNPYLEARRDGEYLTERLTEESVGFLRGRRRDKPFLLYLSYYNVHTPIQAYERRVEHFREKAAGMGQRPEPRLEHEGVSRVRQDNAEYASMVSAVDDSVGRLLGVLREQGLEESTVVIFFSDNGGLCTLAREGPTSNQPLRAGKGWLYEGGIREPMIMRVPWLERGAGVCDVPVVSMDFFPTVLELAGLGLRPDLHRDGESMVGLLRGEGGAVDRELVWHYPHYHGSTWGPGAAIREGRWKLLELYEYDEVELYDLDLDPGELHDLSGKEVERTAGLRGRLRRWQERMEARMPELNPVYGVGLGGGE
jgi:arylsulfatase A-like enzyme